MAVILRASEGKRHHYFGAVASLRLGDRVFPVLPYPEGSNIRIRWAKVEPIMLHADGNGHDPVNPDFLWYTNAGAPGGRLTANHYPRHDHVSAK